jgi:hypothetical protein
MPFITTPLEKDRCLLVTYTGRSSMDDLMSGRFATSRYLSRKGWSRVVVDISALQTIPSIMEIINLASDLSSDLPRDARIALVAGAGQAEYARLVERVARIENVNFHLFWEMAQARAWVEEEHQHGQTDARGPSGARNPT